MSTRLRSSPRPSRRLLIAMLAALGRAVLVGQEAHAMTGDADYLLKLVVRDLKGLSVLVNEGLLPHESMARVRSSIVLETLKDEPQLPLAR